MGDGDSYAIGDDRIEVDAPSLSPEAIEAFRVDVRGLSEVYEQIREAAALPSVRVSVLLSGDFERAVDQRMSDRNRPLGPFTAERVGGLAAAKNLPQSEDGSDVLVIFNADFWVNAGTLARTRARNVPILPLEADIAKLKWIVGHLCAAPLIRPSIGA